MDEGYSRSIHIAKEYAMRFNLREACIEIIKSVELTSPNNLVKLNIDVQLDDSFEGDLFAFTTTIKELSFWMTSYLVNGIIKIEIEKQTSTNNLFIVSVKMSGTGVRENGGPITNANIDSKALSTLVESLPLAIDRKMADGRLVLEFKLVLESFQESSQVAREFEGLRVLLAEDSEVNAMVFTEFLKEWGCEVDHVVNGREAVDFASVNTYDIILMDIYMPELNGYDATQKIRQMNANIPVVMLTASNHEEDIHKSRLSGANDLLLKPIESAQLFRLIKKYV